MSLKSLFRSAPVQPSRYRALFIRHKHGTQLADWMLRLENEIVVILSQDLDLTVIDQDFDYGEVCDKYNPDFVIFDAPGGHRSTPVVITNIDARPDIPRIGFTNQDPHDTARTLYMRMMDEWKIERFFCLWGAAAMRHAPELLGRVFTAPLYFDGDMYKEYGLKKEIAVSLFGWGVAPDFYAWRTSIVTQIINYFPTLVYPHPGYSPSPERHRFPITGVDYAQMVNRSHFSLADTTRLDYLVRKHLEIPGVGTVLITPATSDLWYYGFRDLENCIMGSGMELFQKIAYVANDEVLYEKIRKNGHDLVHSRYTRDKWHYIRDWYTCQRSLKPGDTVQQQGVFGPFIGVPAGPNVPAVATEPLHETEFTVQMKQTLQLILENRLEEAEAIMRAMIKWLGHLAEPYMPLGVIELLRGHLIPAKEFFLRAYEIRLARERGCSCMDPEEITWLTLVGVLMGDRSFVQQMREEAVGVRHLSLRRLEWLFGRQSEQGISIAPEIVTFRQPDDRISTHWLSQIDISNWIILLNRILTVNQQGA